MSTVVVTKELSAKEAETVAAWTEQIFAPLETARRYRWSSDCRFNVLVYLDDELVSYLKIVERPCTFDDAAVRVGGIGCVMTHPSFRQRGFAEQALQLGRRVIFNELKAEAGLLLCMPELAPFYVQYGWQPAACPVTFDQPQGKSTWPHMALLLTPDGSLLQPGAIDLCGLPW